MEQVNKQFVIGGATAEGQSAAMLQLTQAMAAGALRGEELNSILENAPGIARAIESYMGVAEGSIKQYAEQGLITSEVVKNALFCGRRNKRQICKYAHDLGAGVDLDGQCGTPGPKPCF